MKNKDLIAILENLSPDAEIVVEVSNIVTGNHIADTYDVGFALAENRDLKLQVAVEMATKTV
jgi:hypothetical protein